MEDFLTRFMENFVGRVQGPMHFRMLFQPLMASIFAVRDGLKDAREGKRPYGWVLFNDPGQRREMLRQGLKSEGKIFILALVLDAIYQYIELKWFYPGEALLVAILLALVPYLVLRGLTNRLFGAKTVK